ncbi:MAG: DUF1553 domain-containing protein [Pirellulaceae bacterium]
MISCFVGAWDTEPKQLVRAIVLTDAYARAWTSSPSEEVSDPDNLWWWRGERRRLDAESLRDAMLQVSGELWLRRGSEALPAKLKEDYGFESASPVRSVYLPAFRNAINDLLAAFDMADPSVVVGQRNRSTVAPQALALLHDPWVRTSRGGGSSIADRGATSSADEELLGRDSGARSDWILEWLAPTN